VIKKALIN